MGLRGHPWGKYGPAFCQREEGHVWLASLKPSTSRSGERELVSWGNESWFLGETGTAFSGDDSFGARCLEF